MTESLKGSFIEEIKSRILSGSLKPGERLPSERELAKEAGISRGSVNQGILDLERMGFLRIVPRKGTFVSEYGKNVTPETLAAIMNYDSAAFDSNIFSDFMDLRILIEKECVRLICINPDDEKKRLLVEATENLFSSSDSVEAVYQYHRCLADLSENTAYTLVFQSFCNMIRNLISEHYKNSDEAEKSLPKFRKLTSAIINGDATEAERCLLSLLGSASEYLTEHLKK